MDIRLRPAFLAGTLTPPPSKSLQHRYIIAEWLANGKSRITPASEDAERTENAVRQLFAGGGTVDCGASGTTLRLLMPLAAVMGAEATFTGTPRLLARPLGRAVPYERTEAGLRLLPCPFPEEITVKTEQTSQELSGWLFALPLLPDDRRIRLAGETVSHPYIEMTRSVLREYGIVSEKTETGFFVPGGQTYTAPSKTPVIEADASAAAFFLVANAHGAEIDVRGLAPNSRQGDADIAAYLASFPSKVCLADTPDLFPPLALHAALQAGRRTAFFGLARLRNKESDRVRGVTEILTAFGVETNLAGDTLTVVGREKLRGGDVSASDDHRLAMTAAIAAAFAEGETLLHGAETVGKSYPAFWEDYRRIGGVYEEV